ncbi:MAG: HepT-like ribonuclease domain-containing protein [Acidimicrobiales bacterium]
MGAIDAISSYLAEGSLDEGVVYDACRARLIEIGEAVKHLDPKVIDQEQDIPWRAIARMRDQLTHHYFDTDHAIVAEAVAERLPALRTAIERPVPAPHSPDRGAGRCLIGVTSNAPSSALMASLRVKVDSNRVTGIARLSEVDFDPTSARSSSSSS